MENTFPTENVWPVTLLAKHAPTVRLALYVHHPSSSLRANNVSNHVIHHSTEIQPPDHASLVPKLVQPAAEIQTPNA
jgi:hypothetical protein